jgi:ribosomal-protein-alanine N-acetyltransferase
VNAAEQQAGLAQIRPARLRDLEDLMRVDKEVFGPVAYPDFVLRQLFDVHGHHLLVLDTASGLQGYALLAAARGCEVGWVLGLGVREPLRRMGHGRQLLTRSLRELTECGVREARLCVEPDNTAAITLYRSFRFEPIGKEDDYLGPGRPRTVMSLPLAEPAGTGEAHPPQRDADEPAAATYLGVAHSKR